MSGASDHYAAQVAKCAEQAAETTLANVRDRCLRSREVWQTLLDREARSIALKDGRPKP